MRGLQADELVTWLVETFSFLSVTRNSGMSLGAIPLTELLAYLSVYEVPMCRKEFIYYIRQMDIAFLNFYDKVKK